MMRIRAVVLAAAAAGWLAGAAQAEEVTVTIHSVSADGVGDQVGSITFSDSHYGLLISPRLQGLTPGLHGLHVHQNADCGPGPNDAGETIAAGAAGGHFDPEGLGVHAGPYGAGHLGDLPDLMVGQDGQATLVLLAPRMSVAELAGRSIVVHAEADDYSAMHPGGSRAYCGVVP